MVATPGTIPALPPYQPGALPITGQEAVEIVNSTNATTASSWSMLITDIVGKAPSAMALANPTANDLVAFFRSNGTSGGLYFSATVGNLVNIPAGNLPTGGNTSQILAKNSPTNYDASWVNIAALMTTVATGGLTITGSTVAAFAIASGGVGSTQLGAFAVEAGNIATGVIGSAQIASGAIGSTELGAFAVEAGNIATGVVGSTQLGTSAVNLATSVVTGILPNANMSAVNLATTGAGGVQGVLPVSDGGTNTSTLTANGILYGAGTATVRITAAANSAVLVTNASGTPSLAQTLPNAVQTALTQLGTVTTGTWNAGVIGVSYGGTNTSTLTANSVLYGNGTSTIGIVAAATATGQMVMGQGTASPPVMQYPGHTLLNTLTASNSSSIQDTTSFTTAFNDYLLIFENLVPAAAATMEMLFQAGGAFTTSGYQNAGTAATTFIDVGVGVQVGTTSGYGMTGCLWLHGVNSANLKTAEAGRISFLTSSGGYTAVAPACGGAFASITGFQIKAAAATLTSGSVRIYGMRTT